MKNLKSFLLIALMPLMAFAQEHGHSHGAGGENEHLYPVLGIFGALIVIGGALYFMNNKKK